MKNADMPAMPQVVAEDSRGNGLVGSYMEEEWQGLTKREMFAMHIIGHLANGTAGYDEQVFNKAKVAVEYADALLKELEKLN